MTLEHRNLACLVADGVSQQAIIVQNAADLSAPDAAQSFNRFVNDANELLDQRVGDRCPARLVFQTGGRVALGCNNAGPGRSLNG